MRAQVLLLADVGKNSKNKEKSLHDAEIAERTGCSKSSVGNVRKRFESDRLDALEEKTRSGRPRIIDGQVEAQIIAIACSEAPEGQERWTLRLIADRLVELSIDIEEISYTTIGKTLKKMNLNLG